MTEKAKIDPSLTNLQKLPALHAALAQHKANHHDVTAAFNDKVTAMREKPDPETGKSVADMLKAEKKAIDAIEAEILIAWKYPEQINFDLGGV